MTKTVDPRSNNAPKRILDSLCRIKELCEKQYFFKVIDSIEQKTYIQQRADKIILYRSILDKTGAIHKVEHMFNLK